MNVHSASVSVVLLGNFRPERFMPDKLADSGLVTKKMASSATFSSLLPGQQVSFKFGWGDLLVTPDRLQILTTEAPYVRTSDFVLKAFADLAPESSISSFGINRESHYNLGSNDARNELGMRLAPPDAWGDWGAKVKQSMQNEDKGSALQGGVTALQVRKPFRNEGIGGWLDITIGPSSIVPNFCGVLFRANHHHQLAKPAEGEEGSEEPVSVKDMTSRLLNVLSTGFDQSILQSEAIFQGVIAR